MEYTVMFNNGIWDDIVTFKIKSPSKREALLDVLIKNPEYSGWNYFII